jgi:F-type H+-transporting ATPase subunit epsilon
MSGTMHLQIVTPERAVFSAAVNDVTLPGEVGEIGVLSGHRPLLTLIRPGTLIAHTDMGPRPFAVGSGFAEVSGSTVNVVVGACEGVDTIDVNAARASLVASEKRITARDFVDDREMQEHVEEAARARARIELVERATRK